MLLQALTDIRQEFLLSVLPIKLLSVDLINEKFPWTGASMLGKYRMCCPYHNIDSYIQLHCTHGQWKLAHQTYMLTESNSRIITAWNWKQPACLLCPGSQKHETHCWSHLKAAATLMHKFVLRSAVCWWSISGWWHWTNLTSLTIHCSFFSKMLNLKSQKEGQDSSDSGHWPSMQRSLWVCHKQETSPDLNLLRNKRRQTEAISARAEPETEV